MPESMPSTETAADLMVQNIPTALVHSSVSDVLQKLSENKWDDIRMIYVISADQKLLGTVRTEQLLTSPRTHKLEQLMATLKLSVTPDTDQERVVIEAIKKDLDLVPVVDSENRLLGVVLSDKIIDVLHEEHLEDFLRSSGIFGRGSAILTLVSKGVFGVVRVRIPWLIMGLLIGLGLGLISSRFETSLQENIALAFFIPVIAYLADSVGTQSETIYIRASTVLKIKMVNYLFREVFIGIIIGIILGILGGLGGALISQSPMIGVVVGMSLFLAIIVSTILACLVPAFFKFLGKDPALGSGPLATAVQDLISLTIYFLIATAILG